MGALALAGSHGGLQTIKSAFLCPLGNKLACSKVMYCFKLSFSIFSAAQFTAKVLVEVAFTPFMYKIVAFLKRAENEDYYDTKTDFSPFTLK